MDYIDVKLRNTSNEGYIDNVEASNLLVYDFSGAMIFAGLAFSGAWQYIKMFMGYGLLKKLIYDEVTLPEYATHCNSVFDTNRKEMTGTLYRGFLSRENANN